MFKISKHKKNSVPRAGYLAVALAILGIFGGIGLTTVSISVSAQEQTHYCEEVDGRFVPSKDPCIAKEIIKCTPGQPTDPCADPAVKANCKSISCNAIIKDYVEPGIKVLIAMMGVVVAISIVVAGIQYGSAGSDPGKVAAAKKRLSSALLALVTYLFMFAFLQWLLPGGVL